MVYYSLKKVSGNKNYGWFFWLPVKIYNPLRSFILLDSNWDLGSIFSSYCQHFFIRVVLPLSYSSAHHYYLKGDGHFQLRLHKAAQQTLIVSSALTTEDKIIIVIVISATELLIIPINFYLLTNLM